MDFDIENESSTYVLVESNKYYLLELFSHFPHQSWGLMLKLSYDFTTSISVLILSFV